MKKLTIFLIIALTFAACDSAQKKEDPKPEPSEASSPEKIAAPDINNLNNSLEKYPIAGFDYKSSKMPESEWAEWAKSAAPIVKKIISSLPENYVLQATGHTDSIGPEEPTSSKPGNLRISRDRAKTVYNALIKAGITSEKLTYKGVGSSIPDTKYNPKDSRQRRVTFMAIKK